MERQNWGNIKYFFKKRTECYVRRIIINKKEDLEMKNMIAEKNLNKKAGRSRWGTLPKAKWKDREERKTEKEGRREGEGERERDEKNMRENVRGTDD